MALGDGLPEGVHQLMRLRSFDGGIAMDSRYLATVLRATCIPSSTNVVAILLSDKGFVESSAAMNFRIMARIAVAEHSPPLAVETWLLKKYLNSNMPRGV